MLNPEDYVFLEQIEKYVKDRPHVGAYVSGYVAKGIDKSRVEALERAADMETALSLMMSTRFKTHIPFVLEKLERWNGKSSLEWKTIIKGLRDKLPPDAVKEIEDANIEIKVFNNN